MPLLPAWCFAGDHFIVCSEANLPIPVLNLHIGQLDASRGAVCVARERGAQQGNLFARGADAESGVHQAACDFL
jgi:hypothetical protein